MNTRLQIALETQKRLRARRCVERRVRPDWLELGVAYDEAVSHLINCAAESEDASERLAYEIVARRIQAAGNRLRPNTERTDRRGGGSVA